MSSLSRQTLGRTGPVVTPLGYGAMELRDTPRGPAISDHQAREVLRDCRDLKPAHLHENVLAARKGPLPADVVTELKRQLEQTASSER